MKHTVLFSVLALVLSFAAAASAVELAYPTVDVGGVPHFLADSDDTTGEWFDTANGYCVLQGHKGMSQSAGVPATQGPLVRLDNAGKVVSTFKDTKGGKLWVVASVSCY